MMPEQDRVALDEDDVPWDADNGLPERTDGIDDAAISGTRDVQ